MRDALITDYSTFGMKDGVRLTEIGPFIPFKKQMKLPRKTYKSPWDFQAEVHAVIALISFYSRFFFFGKTSA